MNATDNAELRADTIALLRATIRADMDAVHAIASGSERNAELFRSLVSFVLFLGESCCGDLEAFDILLANVQKVCIAGLAESESPR